MPSPPINGKSGQPAPRGRVGVWFLCCGQWDNLALAGSYMLNPFASEEDRKYNPIYRCWHEVFSKLIDPCRQWCASGDDFSVIVDLERPVGILGDNRRFFSIADVDRAKRYGQSYLYDGLDECIGRYTEAGNEVVVHMGRLNSDQWANNTLKSGRCFDKAEVLRVTYEAHEPFIRAGARIGMDNLSEAGRTEPDYFWAKFLESCDVPIQAEATTQITHWKGTTSRIVWGLFNDRHYNQTPWAIEQKWLRWDSPDFAKWYPDLRVTLTANAFDGTDPGKGAAAADRKAWIVGQAAGVKKLLADCPTVSVLLTPRHIDEAKAAGMTVKDFA